MSAIDFAKFKKINQDKKSATLLHPDGHEIKISIANLSPVLKKKLEELPLHQAKPKGPVKKLDDDSPATVEDTVDDIPDEIEEEIAKEPQAQPAQAPAPQAQQPVQQQPAPEPQAAPQAQAPAPQPAPQAAAPAPEQPPAQQPAQAEAPPAPEQAEKTPEQIAQEKNQQDMAFASDVQMQHIKPKTYGDLFAEKSTLGKVGTIFGMMLSGIGSGLTHQPNALLAMMDKQIQNDLDAQEKDQSNRQNLMKLSLEHTKNQFDNELTNSVTTKNTTENEREQFFNDNMEGFKSMGRLNADNKASILAYQSQQDLVNKMPAGPQKDAAQNNINTHVIPALMNKIQNNNAKSSALHFDLMQKAKTNLGSAKSNPPPTKGFAKPGVHYDVVDENKKREGFRNGIKYGPKAAFMDNAIPESAHEGINKEIIELGNIRNNWADGEDAFNKLASIKNAGQVPGVGALAPATSVLAGLGGLIFTGGIGAGIAGTLGHLGGAEAKETIKDYYERERNIQVNAFTQRLRDRGMSGEDAKNQAESMLPKWNDDEKTLPEVHHQLQQHMKALEDNKTPNLTQYELKTQQPNYEFKFGKKKETK